MVLSKKRGLKRKKRNGRLITKPLIPKDPLKDNFLVKAYARLNQ